MAGVLTRKANDRNAPPAVRGGCLGALWTLELLPDDAMDEAVKALHSLAPHEQPGDYLGGLFAVARQLVTNDDRLLRAVDHLIDRWTPEEFLTLLPALRRAFAWFPPRERSLIGDRIAALRGLARSTRLTGKLRDEPLLVAAGAVLDARIGERIVNYGLARAVSPSADKQETGPAEVERRKTGPPNVVNSTKRDRW